MANICNTEYVLVGQKENIERCYDDISRIYNKYNKNGEAWLGYLADELLPDKSFMDFECRGDIYWLGDKAEKEITFSVSSKWTPCNELLNSVAKKYGLKLFFFAVEPGFEIYETNDADGRFFPPDGFYLDTGDDIHILETFGEVADILEGILGKRPSSYEEAETQIENYNELTGNSANISQIEYISI